MVKKMKNLEVNALSAGLESLAKMVAKSGNLELISTVFQHMWEDLRLPTVDPQNLLYRVVNLGKDGDLDD